jgi:hypothetical protein
MPAAVALPAALLSNFGLSMAAIRSRVLLGSERPEKLFGEFGTALSEMLAKQLASAAPGEVSGIVSKVAAAFGISFSPSPETGLSALTAALPADEWAAVVAWALLRSAYVGGGCLAPDDLLSFRADGAEGALPRLKCC